MLVVLLTGGFDPPPDALAVPWGYLGMLFIAAAAAVAVAVATALVAARRPLVDAVRDL